MNFSLTYFILSFSIGILIVYLFTPFPEVIIRYPRPNDYHSLRFEKANGVCMEYEMKQVSCDDGKPI